MTDSMDLALKIMDLVDEYPSDPFSFERKVILERLETAIAQHTQQIDGESEVAFETGFYEGKQEAEYEYAERINDLADTINDLEREIESLREENDKAFAEGYETASRTENSIETLDFN